MKFVFCTDPLNLRQPDEAYQAQVAAAERLDILFTLLDHDAGPRSEKFVNGVWLTDSVPAIFLTRLLWKPFRRIFKKRQVIVGIPHQHDRPWRPRFATFGEILPGWSAISAILSQ